MWLPEGRPFFIAGFWSEVQAPATREASDTYALIVTDANVAMRVNDRVPVILDTAVARRWGRARPAARRAAVPYPADTIAAWLVAGIREAVAAGDDLSTEDTDRRMG